MSSAASVFSSPLTNGEDERPGWIDAHVHVWHPDTKKYPLSDRFKQSDMQPPSFTAKELLTHCRPEGVDRIVLIQMSFYEYDHRYMVEMMEASPGVFSGVALIDLGADDVRSEMDRLATLGMKGLRIHSQGDVEEWTRSETMNDLWNKAAENGMAVCPLINPHEIQYVDALCAKHPDTTVVIDHFARIGIDGVLAADDLKALCRLSRFPNTYVKTSAFYALGKKAAPYEDLLPMIRQTVDAFGPQRLMWASDCPFQVQEGHTYKASISLIRDRIHFLSDTDKQWMLRGTAEKVFFTA